jgi:hypothetical protein
MTAIGMKMMTKPNSKRRASSLSFKTIDKDAKKGRSLRHALSKSDRPFNY